MDNSGTRKLNGAKPYIVNQNGKNVTFSTKGVKFDSYLIENADGAC